MIAESLTDASGKESGVSVSTRATDFINAAGRQNCHTAILRRPINNAFLRSQFQKVANIITAEPVILRAQAFDTRVGLKVPQELSSIEGDLTFMADLYLQMSGRNEASITIGRSFPALDTAKSFLSCRWGTSWKLNETEVEPGDILFSKTSSPEISSQNDGSELVITVAPEFHGN